MILTGRTGLLALICVLPIALSPWPARAFVMLLVALAVAVTVDTLLAASTRKLALYPLAVYLRPARAARGREPAALQWGPPPVPRPGS